LSDEAFCRSGENHGDWLAKSDQPALTAADKIERVGTVMIELAVNEQLITSKTIPTL
jgi:hypothetical protein